MNLVNITKNQPSIKGQVNLPASKSISNRLLIIEALSRKPFKWTNLSEAEDTSLMKKLIGQIQLRQGSGSPVELDCKNAGTVFRFLTALLAITPGEWVLTGTKRMKERPIGILVQALRKLGADIKFSGEKNFPPLKISGRNLKGGKVEIDGSISSQYISALLLIAPLLKGGLTVNIINGMASKPYIDMTLGLMRRCGIPVKFEKNIITLSEGTYQPFPIVVEADWSSAAFWYEMAALSNSAELTFRHLGRESLQGDSILPEIYSNLGIETEYLDDGIRIRKSNQKTEELIFDFTNHPDLAPPVIVTSAAMGVIGRFTGLQSLKIKESDRLSALRIELEKQGYPVEVKNNLELQTFASQSTESSGLKKNFTTPVDPHADHRMAMAFAPLAILSGAITIQDPAVVAKSYPGFWEELQRHQFGCNFS